MHLYKSPSTHSGYILWERRKGVADLIDPTSGKWAAFRTVRFAKWTATFIKNSKNNPNFVYQKTNPFGPWSKQSSVSLL